MDFNEAGDDGVAVASADPYANHCTSLQTDDHASISPLSGRLIGYHLCPIE